MLKNMLKGIGFCLFALVTMQFFSCSNPVVTVERPISEGEKLRMDIQAVRAINMSSADAYEQDDSQSAAKAIAVNAAVQEHNFYDDATDWVNLDAVAGTSYTIETWVFGNGDTVMTVYDGSTSKASNDDKGDGTYGSLVSFKPTASKTYTIKITSYSSKTGTNRGYTLGVSAGTVPPPSTGLSLPQPKKAWTVLVYLDGDNNLASFCEGNIAQMRQVGSDDSNLNIVLLYDNGSNIHGYYYVQNDATLLLQNMANPDMGSVTTAKNFINYAATNFPADKYAFVYWNHGGAVDRSLRGVAWDDTSGNHLSEVDQKAIMNYGLSQMGQPFELVGFDACLMATAEIYYQYRGLANYMAASEQTEPGAGWDYNALSVLKSSPACRGDTLAKSICSKYAALTAPSGSDWTFSAIDLSYAGQLANAINEFATSARNAGSSYASSFKGIATALPSFSGYTKDVTAYMNALITSSAIPQAVKDNAQIVKNLIVNNLVIQNQYGSTWNGKAFGCAITMKSDTAVYDQLDLCADSQWNEFCSFAGFPNTY